MVAAREEAAASSAVRATELRALARSSQAASFEPLSGGRPWPTEPLR